MLWRIPWGKAKPGIFHKSQRAYSKTKAENYQEAPEKYSILKEADFAFYCGKYEYCKDDYHGFRGHRYNAMQKMIWLGLFF